MTDTQLPPISPDKGNFTPRPISVAQKEQTKTHTYPGGYIIPGPVHFPGVDHIRNPILGTMLQYTQYKIPKKSHKSSHNKTLHSGGIFEDTSYKRSFYDIHPDWTSESASARRISCTQRFHFAWDNRPAFHPLVDYIIPLLEKRRGTDDKLNSALQSARDPYGRDARFPPHVYASIQGIEPCMSHRDPLRRSLPAELNMDVPPSPTGSPFYKNMLASRVLSPRREATWHN